jgi:hypothetical protein
MRGKFRLEHGLIAGGGLIGACLLGGLWVVVEWVRHGAGGMSEGMGALVAATGVVAGLQILFTSFLLSILGLRRPR